MSFSKRSWRESADRALAEIALESERQVLAEQIAARLLGGVEGVQGRDAGLVKHVARLIDDASVRIALATQYVAGLQKRVAEADYEEARELGQELAWVQSYLEEKLLCPLLLAPEQDRGSRTEGTTVPLLEPLYEVLLQAASRQISIRDDAAA